jgi:hypothetical protein
LIPFEKKGENSVEASVTWGKCTGVLMDVLAFIWFSEF